MRKSLFKHGMFIGVTSLALFFASCGDTESTPRLSVSEVLGIPAGTKEGNGLGGEFSSRYTVTSEGCKDFPILDVRAKDATRVSSIEVVHEAGFISFQSIDGVNLNGGVDFGNSFEVGGTQSLSIGGNEANILVISRMTGVFDGADSFAGEGVKRYLGRVNGSEIDCRISYRVDGIRE